jgi:hypothetical protein
MTDEFFEKVGTKVKSKPAPRPGAESRDPDYEAGVGVYTPPAVNETEIRGRITNHRWARSDDLFWPAAETCDALDAGFYKFDNRSPMGACLQKITISTDNLIRLPDTAAEAVLAEFSTFWGLKDRFTQRGFLHKRGILLWGNPGSGKTASMMLMADDIIHKHGGIVCEIDNPTLAAACLANIRKIEPKRRIVAFLEDLDALVDRYGENTFLSLLDGETQVDNIVYVASTNYPERLDKRFVDRPSRFDTVKWIGMPSANARRVYLQTKEPSLDSDELEQWVVKTDGFSVAHLRELVILVKCFDHPLDVAIHRLESMRMRQPNSEDTRQLFGIGRDSRD